MFLVNYQNGFGWTALLWTGTHLSWYEDGNAYGWIKALGVPERTINAAQLQGLCRGTAKTSPKPWTLDASFSW